MRCHNAFEHRTLLLPASDFCEVRECLFFENEYQNLKYMPSQFYISAVRLKSTLSTLIIRVHGEIALINKIHQLPQPFEG
jgi:hypothetical protein